MLHLDLLVLLAFSLSHVFFNRGEIDALGARSSIPCSGYLLVRMLLGRLRAAPRAATPAAAAGPGRLAGAGADLPRRLPDRPERHQLERDRRRLLGRDRRRSHHPWRAAVRRVPVRQPIGGHVRAGELLRLRSVRAGVPVVRQVGRPAGGARRGAVLRPGDDPGVVLGRQAAAQGPRGTRWESCSRTPGRAIPTRCSSPTRTPTTHWSRCWWCSRSALSRHHARGGRCWRWRPRPSSRRSRWCRCSPPTTGAAYATPRSSRSRFAAITIVVYGAGASRGRYLDALGPYDRLPARPRLAVQHLGAVRIARLAPVGREGGAGRAGPAGGPRSSHARRRCSWPRWERRC